MRERLDRSALPSPEAIARLVDVFYDRVRADPLIGPVFNEAVHDWPEHKRLLRSISSAGWRCGGRRRAS